MKTGKTLTVLLLAAQVCAGSALQQQYEKAYYLETARGEAKQAAALYLKIAEAEPSDANRPVIKQSLLRLLHMATVRKNEATIRMCHEQLLIETDTTIQDLLDAAKPDSTIYIPEGRFEGTFEVNKKNILMKGASRERCILEATADRPLVYAAPRSSLTLESLTLKSQLETSQKSERPGCTLMVDDATAAVRDCRFIALGNNKRCPVSVYVRGFSNARLEACRFEGFEYTIQYGEGTEGHVTDCVVRQSGHCGITAFQDAEVTIENNIITGSGYHGIRSTGGTIHVKDNLLIRNRNRGIYLGSKSASGEVVNNAIVANGTGISSFSNTDVEIENNVILDNNHAGVDTRGSCEIEVKNNIFVGNQSGFTVYEGGNNRFNIGKNTFWKNGKDSTDFKLSSSTLAENPKFGNPEAGNFSVGSSKVKSAGHGLTEPEVISTLWKKYQETVE
jgi:nitrous oxidase accessory protein NosD